MNFDLLPRNFFVQQIFEGILKMKKNLENIKLSLLLVDHLRFHDVAKENIKCLEILKELHIKVIDILERDLFKMIDERKFFVKTFEEYIDAENKIDWENKNFSRIFAVNCYFFMTSQREMFDNLHTQLVESQF